MLELVLEFGEDSSSVGRETLEGGGLKAGVGVELGGRAPRVLVAVVAVRVLPPGHTSHSGLTLRALSHCSPSSLMLTSTRWVAPAISLLPKSWQRALALTHPPRDRLAHRSENVCSVYSKKLSHTHKTQRDVDDAGEPTEVEPSAHIREAAITSTSGAETTRTSTIESTRAAASPLYHKVGDCENILHCPCGVDGIRVSLLLVLQGWG